MRRVLFCFKKKSPFFFGQNTPNDFLYGLDYFQKHRKNVDKIFANNYQLTPEHLFYQYKEKKILKRGVYFQLYLNNKEKINPQDILFAVNDGASLGLLYFKFKKRINNKIVALIQGLHDRWPKESNKLTNFYQNLLKQADLILALSKYEKKLLAKRASIPTAKVKTFYFGTDIKFWDKHQIEKPERQADFVLTIGNDRHRDYQLLINHYSLNTPLRFITKKLNYKQIVTVLKSKKFSQHRNVSPVKLRQYYNQAKFIIIPLIKTTQATSGLSACLQALAMEKPVLLAKTPPMTELFEDKKQVLFYQPGKPSSFKRKLHQMNNNSKLRKTLAENSREIIEEKFNSVNMTKQLKAFLAMRSMK